MKRVLRAIAYWCFLMCQSPETKSIKLEHFRSRFFDWINHDWN
jgi:hypothetical protein